jgi:hypothetical protein
MNNDQLGIDTITPTLSPWFEIQEQIEIVGNRRFIQVDNFQTSLINDMVMLILRDVQLEFVIILC